MLGFHGMHHASRNMAGEAAVVRAEEKADRAQNALARMKAKSEEATAMIVRKGLTAGAAGALGFWQGYKGEMPELLGVGADLWIGGGASLVALFADELGLDDKTAGYIDAVGTGALAYWAANQGNMYGVKKAEGTSATGTGGADPAEFAPHMPAQNAGGAVHQETSVPFGYR